MDATIFKIKSVKKRKIYSLLSVLIVFLILISLNTQNTQKQVVFTNSDSFGASSIIETFDGVEVSSTIRRVNLEGTGLVTVRDTFTVKNDRENPLSFISVGINESYLEDLVYYNAEGSFLQTLEVQFSEEMIESYRMIYIFFDTPLLPSEQTSFTFIQTYQNLYNYTGSYTEEYSDQTIGFDFYIYPILPYQVDDAQVTFFLPEGGLNLRVFNDSDEEETITEDSLKYSKTSIPTFYYVALKGEFTYTQSTKLQLDSVQRKIMFNSLGYLLVEETHEIHNTGPIPITGFTILVPAEVSAITVYDDIGPLTGASLAGFENLDGKTKDLTITLSTNRVKLNPDAKLRFYLTYALTYDNYHIFNWIEQSISINIHLITCDFIILDQEVEIIIDGCGDILSLSEQPKSIESQGDDVVLVYDSGIVAPLEDYNIKIIYTLDVIEILMRPLIFTILILLGLIGFVILTKSRKPEAEEDIYRKADIPVNELRQFCTLCEERNAVLLEILQADDDVKRKKLTKKKYINLIKKCEARIKTLDDDIVPLRKLLEESTNTFDNTFKKFDDLEAKRISLKDSINLLENRYKQGRMPSREAYEKLLRDLLKQRDKIKKAVDRLVNEMKAYLI